MRGAKLLAILSARPICSQIDESEDGSRLTHSTEGQIFDHVAPFFRIRSNRDQFQIADVFSNRAAKLVAKQKSRKRSADSLPLLGSGFESNVLREENAIQFG